MNKLMKSASMLLTLFVVAAVLLFTGVAQKAFARALGTWEYPSLILGSSQTLSVAGAASFSGAETHTGAEVHSGAVDSFQNSIIIDSATGQTLHLTFIGAAATKPNTATGEGTVYYDTTLHQLGFYNGSAWKTASWTTY